MAIYRGSRYARTVVYNFINEDLRARPTLTRPNVKPTLRRRTIERFSSEEGTMHTWIEGDRLDSLAYQHYGDASRWWVILDANPKYLTPWDIRPGDVLIIPSYREIQQRLESL